MGTDIRRYTYTNNDYVYSHNNRIKTDVCKYHIRRSSSMLLVTFKNQYQSPEKNKRRLPNWQHQNLQKNVEKERRLVAYEPFIKKNRKRNEYVEQISRKNDFF